jgi:hypothetical protein
MIEFRVTQIPEIVIKYFLINYLYETFIFLF